MTAKEKSIENDSNFKKTSDQQLIYKIMAEKLLNEKMTIQMPMIVPKFGRILKVSQKGIIVQFLNFIPPLSALSMTGFINEHYTEIGLTVKQSVKDDIYLCAANFLRIASQRRMDARYKIVDDREVYISRIQIAKSDLNFEGKRIPVAYSIVFDNFVAKYGHIADKFCVASFQDAYGIYDKVYRSGQTIFVRNSKDMASFLDSKGNSDFLDLQDEYGSSFIQEQVTMVRTGKIGWIVCPILAINSAGNYRPVGYIEVISKTALEIETLLQVKTVAMEIIDQLRDMNVMEVKKKQKLLDMSRNGLCMQVSGQDQELVNSIVSRSNLVFDLIIKGQAPITMLGWIRSSKVLENADLMVGMKIQGESDRQHQMKRYFAFIKELSTREAKQQ